MGETIRVQGVEVEVESRYRVELGAWQASLRHPVYGFTAVEWAGTPAEAAKGAHRALLFYAREMERFTGSPEAESKAAAA